MEFEYFDGDLRCLGEIALPDEHLFPGPRPGVVVVHEAWGLGAQVQRRIKMLAELGYVALAADMFGNRLIPAGPPEAFKIIGDLADNPPVLRARVTAAVDALKAHPRVNGQLAATGYCFGGRTVLELARSGNPDIMGVVSFHGALDTKLPAVKGEVKAKVLVCHGAEDELVPHDHLNAFLTEMASAGVDCQTIAYTGAHHSFTNPEANGSLMSTIIYHEPTDRRSWNAMKVHLEEVFGA